MNMYELLSLSFATITVRLSRKAASTLLSDVLAATVLSILSAVSVVFSDFPCVRVVFSDTAKHGGSRAGSGSRVGRGWGVGDQVSNFVQLFCSRK